MSPSQRRRLLLVAGALATAIAYALAHHTAHGAHGWWGSNDQHRYIVASRAWARGAFDPAEHWYFPGYPLIGASLLWLNEANPFYLPNLACLLVYAWLFVVLAERLAPDYRHVTRVAVIVFVTTALLSPSIIRSYVEPWTSTPTAPIALASLLVSIRFSEHPSWRRAFFVGLVPLATVLFRPTEALLLAAVIAPFALSVIVALEGPLKRKSGLALAGALGAIIPVLVLAALHCVTHGLDQGTYIKESRQVGFEWRLFPIRWVMLFVCPRPLFEDTEAFGIIEKFPWVALGIAGMIASLAVVRRRLLRYHALTIAAIVVHCAVFTVYRDLHPQGLWRFGNYHYFKWVVPLFGLYAVFFIVLVQEHARRRIVWVASATAVTLMFMWRPVWVDSGSSDGLEVDPPRILRMDRGLDSVNTGIRVTARGRFDDVYNGNHAIHAGEVTLSGNNDFKAFPTLGGFLLLGLRPFPPGPAELIVGDRDEVEREPPPRWGRQTVEFGIPPWRIHVNRKVVKWWRSL